jgi:Zn-dependent M16 (insulinase) family peptidase
MRVDESSIEKFGFELVQEQDIAELNTRALLLRHRGSGARLLSLHNDDENKVFGINFRTPVADSTGIAHIMEHSVLCGSEKFPVKEPFVELMKGSLNTFLNAFTYPDKTCYPVASQNIEDFYNLVEVYLDAVFFPKISAEILKQEGWHYEIDSVEGKDELIYKGVVYNEMKGSYSSPMTLMYQYAKEHLYPANQYRYSSGGDPEVIPDITYEQFRSFHKKYYHPSNSWIYFYGDNDLEGRLAIVSEYLNRFKEQPLDSGIDLQPTLAEPQEFLYHYDAGEAKVESKTMMTLNWLLPEGTDVDQVMALSVLDYILLGSSAAPLEKALIDSGLGESVIGGGLATELRQLNYSVGLKNFKSFDVGKVEQLILNTLGSLVEEGIPSATIEAALNTVEFSLRENNTGRYPRGLSLMLRALTRWLHDEEPFKMLAYEASLQSVKKAASTPGFFEQLIERFLLNNPHRVKIILEPQEGYALGKTQAEKQKLATIFQTLSEEEKEFIKSETKALNALQAKEDTPEALATIPSLSLDQLDRVAKKIPTQCQEIQGRQHLVHDLFTNGISYFDIAFDLRGVDRLHIPYLPMFCRMLFQMGTSKKGFVELVQAIDRLTGGVSASPWVLTRNKETKAAAYLLIRGKVLSGKEGQLFDILKEVVEEINLDQQDRFLQLVRQRKSGLESSVTSSGHSYAMTRLSGMFSQAGWINEQIEGISQLLFIRQLEQEVTHNWSKVLTVLQSLRELIFRRENCVANVTLSAEAVSGATMVLENFQQSLNSSALVASDWPLKGDSEDFGVVIPSLVNYVAKGGVLYDYGYTYHGSIKVISKYLRSSYLWDKIRVQGGAYGAFCSFSKATGFISFCSYRDPNFAETLAAYDAAADFLLGETLSDDELRKNIIGTIGDLDTYQLPDAKGMTAFGRYMRGISDLEVQEEREQVFETSKEEFAKLGGSLKELMSHARVAALGPESSFVASKLGIEPMKIF